MKSPEKIAVDYADLNAAEYEVELWNKLRMAVLHGYRKALEQSALDCDYNYVGYPSAGITKDGSC